MDLPTPFLQQSTYLPLQRYQVHLLWDYQNTAETREGSRLRPRSRWEDYAIDYIRHWKGYLGKVPLIPLVRSLFTGMQRPTNGTVNLPS